MPESAPSATPPPASPASSTGRPTATTRSGCPWFGPIAAGLVEELSVRPGERVLDVGCGRGAALVPLSHATGPGGSALGIDLAPRMVDVRTAHREVVAEFADPQQWLDFSWSHGQRAMGEAVPTQEHDRVRAEIVSLLEGFSPLGFRQTIRHTLGRRP